MFSIIPKLSFEPTIFLNDSVKPMKIIDCICEKNEQFLYLECFDENCRSYSNFFVLGSFNLKLAVMKKLIEAFFQ